MDVVGRSEGDQILAALGVHRLALPIPFAQAGGPANAYLLENDDGSLTLFDTGVDSPECLKALEQGFAEVGRRLEEVSRVLVSHGHVDHFGLARHVQDRAGAAVHVHRRDWNKVLIGRQPPPMAELGERLGLSAATVEHLAAMRRGTEAYAPRLSKVEPLEGGTRLRFKHFEAEVLHFPGHTPGLVCLHLPEQRMLLSDDHLLARVSPNPLLEPVGDGGERHRALVAYLDSARRLREMELGWLAPGHGEPFQGHRATLDSLFRFYARRQDRLAAALVERPRTAMELVQELFGEASSLQLFLMLSEVVGNLEVLEEQGRVGHEAGETPWRFRVLTPTRSPG